MITGGNDKYVQNLGHLNGKIYRINITDIVLCLSQIADILKQSRWRMNVRYVLGKGAKNN